MYVGVDFFFPCLFQISKKHVSVSYKKSFLWGKKHTRICYLFLNFSPECWRRSRDNDMFIDLHNMTSQPQRPYAFSYEHCNS